MSASTSQAIPKGGKVNCPRYGCATAEEKLRPVLKGKRAHFLHLDLPGLPANAVVDSVEPYPIPVAVPATRESGGHQPAREPHHRVARFQER